MNTKKLILQSLAAGGVLALAFTLFADEPMLAQPNPDRTSRSDDFEEIDSYIERQMERLNVPGAALAIVEGDEIVHLRGFGKARPGGEAPTPQTPFAVGSTTKSFTALALMQLVEAGKIDLDAPVQRYLPWFRVADPRASSQMRVRHLLNQTSGLPTSAGEIQLANLDTNPSATERQARALSTLELTRRVGAAWEYSNANYSLLGLIIEAASGESYEAYVQNHIFTPLEMTHSYTSQAEAKKHGMAVGHRYWFATPVATPDLPMPRGSLPAGQLISSSEDMAHYLIAQLSEGRYGDVQILSAAGIDELHRPAVEVHLPGISSGQYGMGWFIEETGKTKIVWHGGEVPDFCTYMAILPERKQGVALLMNADHFVMDGALTEVGKGVGTLLADEVPVPIPSGAIPWALRGLLLIPVLQIVGVAATLRRLAHWRQDPTSHPSGGRKWRLHILLPLIPKVLVSLPLLGMLWTGTLGVFLVYMPDVSWIALVCGSFALAWMFVRTGLVLRTLRKPSLS